MNQPPESCEFRPTANWQNLRLRAELLARLRQFFAEHGFLEVETPLLSPDIVVDRHIDPFEVPIEPGPDGRTSLWLQTSPEAAMKRLMAAGGEAIYQVTRSFRRGERGRLHNWEFTIIEWYRRGDDMQDGIDLLDRLAQAMLERGPAEKVSYRQAFLQCAGVDPFSARVPQLREAARRQINCVPQFDREDRDWWLDLLLVHCVEPHLGRGRPTILMDYPASQAALAVTRGASRPVAERFELYVEGVELANGYHELVDPEILRQRQEAANRARLSDGKSALPGAPRLGAAMRAGLPNCTGVALGFDRLVMLAAAAASIDEVIAFPASRA